MISKEIKMDNKMKHRNVIVHVHIFKNAGSSFDDTLLTNFNDNFIDHRDDNLIKNDKKFLENFLIVNNTVKAFSSHSIYHKPKDFDNVKLHTAYFLRHPIERIRSVYSFEKKQPAKDSLGATKAKELNFKEYIAWRMQEDVPATIRNLQTIFLAGDGLRPNHMKKKFTLAFKNLHDSPLIGVVDRYDESMVVFEEYLKQFFPNIDLSYIRKNVTDTNIDASVKEKVEKLLQQLDEPVQKLVKEKNAFDLELYEKANILLDEKITKIEDFDKKLNDFKERCKAKPTPSAQKEKINKIERKIKILPHIYTEKFRGYKESLSVLSKKLAYKINPFKKEKKKKVFIQANCQGASLKHIFERISRLTDKYEILTVKPVHLWKDEDKEDLLHKIQECDIFLHQPILEQSFGFFASDNLKKYLKKNAIAVSFPNLYFTGYHPQAFYMKDSDGKKVSEPFDYHDQNIFKFYSEVLPKETVLDKIKDEKFYSNDEIKTNIDKSLRELREREENTSIKVSNFIEENMIGKKLFHIFNHPTNELLFYLFDRILENIEESILSAPEKSQFKKELLGAIQYPIYPSVQNYFAIKEPLSLVNRGKTYTSNEVIDMYFNYYTDAIKKNQKNTRDIIVHVHIFKNAGSSFDDTLLTNFNDNFIDHREDTLIRSNKIFLKDYLLRNNKVKAFSSHSIYHKPEDFDNVKLHTAYFLRHPIERIRSVYSFEKKQPAKDSLGATKAKELDFQEYIAWRMQDDAPPTIRNLQTIFFAGTGHGANKMDKKFELALKTLNDSPLVGVVDRYDESMVIFEEYLKQFFTNIDLSYIRQNITDTNIKASVEEKVEKLLQQFDEPLQELVKKKNAFDLELYEKANTLLDEKIDKIEDFDKKLNDFKERCKLMSKS